MKTLPKPSPALFIGTFALIVALGGTAAATTAASQKKIDGSQIKANSITGKQVKESTLATVPRATSAGELGSLKPVAFRVIKPVAAGTFELLALKNEATVHASCTTGPTPSIAVDGLGTPSRDLEFTYADNNGNTYTFGPPEQDAGISHVDTDFTTTINAFTRSGPVEMSHLVILAVDEGKTCEFDVGGETSIPLVR